MRQCRTCQKFLLEHEVEAEVLRAETRSARMLRIWDYQFSGEAASTPTIEMLSVVKKLDIRPWSPSGMRTPEEMRSWNLNGGAKEIERKFSDTDPKRYLFRRWSVALDPCREHAVCAGR